MRGHAPLDEECGRRGLQPRLGVAVVTMVTMVAIAKAVGVVGENIPTGMDGGIEIRKGVVGGAVIGEDCSGGVGGSSSSSGSRGGWISIVAIGGAGAGSRGLIIAGSGGGGGSGSRRVSYSTGGITAVATGGADVWGGGNSGVGCTDSVWRGRTAGVEGEGEDADGGQTAGDDESDEGTWQRRNPQRPPVHFP